MKEWLGALKVAKDIIKGGISAYKAGEVVDALIGRSMDEYGSLLTKEERSLYDKYKSASEEEEKTKLRLAYMALLAANISLPDDFRAEVEKAAEEYRKAENFAVESMEQTFMDYAETEEQKAAIRNAVDGFKK